MTRRDRIFVNSKLMYEMDGGYKCGVCGAICRTPGTGHAEGCALDEAVSTVAPKETADALMARLRMEATEKLSGSDIDRCHELANLVALSGPAGLDDALEKVAAFCGREAVSDGVLRGFSSLDAGDVSYQQIVTRLMCERMWFIETVKQPVTPPVK